MPKKKEIFGTAVVKKRNVLNELRNNNMSLPELRFFSIYLSKINPKDKSTRVVSFPVDDFRRIMELGTDMNMTHFKNAITGILQKVVHVPSEDGSGFDSFQLFKKAKLRKNEFNEWYVELDAHDDALPLMFDFKNKFFKYELWNALRLKSANQIRMYEILKQYEGIGRRELPITELKELLGIGKDEYADRWDNFKSRVLDSCQQALKEYTDICFTYERGKVGRGGKWITIVFHIKKNENHKDPLTLDEFIEKQPESEPISYEPIADEIESEYEQQGYEYEDDRIAIIAAGCKNEFSEVEMQHIISLIDGKQLPKHPYDTPPYTTYARSDYLQKMYSKLDVYTERNNIKKENRYSYFCKMLENDKNEVE